MDHLLQPKSNEAKTTKAASKGCRNQMKRFPTAMDEAIMRINKFQWTETQNTIP